MKQTTKRTLNNLVETHLTSIIANSISIARHSKRRRCSTNQSTSSSSLIATPTIHASDVLAALKINGTPIDLPTNAGYTNNQPVDLNDFLEKESDPQIDTPSELGMVMHWLAVEGKQPTTPLNPVMVVAHNAASDGVSDGANTNVEVETVPTPSTHPNQQLSIQETHHNEKSTNNNNNVTIRNLLPRLLSEELQLYFTRITLALQKEDDTHAQDAALSRLRYDSGIQELIPFFLNFLTPTSNTQISNVNQSLLRMHCVNNIVQNSNLHLELYLEKIVPLVLNCIVPKKLSWNDYDHWKLRDVASSVLLSLWTTFGEKYTSFQSSVIRVLVQAMMMTTKGGSSVESRYGALVALSGLGPKVVDAVVLPCIGQFWVESEMQLEKYDEGYNGDNGALRKDDREGRRFALYRLQDALLVSYPFLFRFICNS